MNVFPFPRRRGRPNESTKVRRVLADLAHSLVLESRDELTYLAEALPDPQRRDHSLAAVRTLGIVRSTVERMHRHAAELSAIDATVELETLAALVIDAITTRPSSPASAGARADLARVAQEIHIAQNNLFLFSFSEEVTPATAIDRVPCIEIRSDVLFQLHQGLFPAERMMVAAGHRAKDGTLSLGATFDVTGTDPDTHHSHVRADPDKLGQALVAMELTGAELAAWIHSHPGRGAAATTPSPIDVRQHQDWLHNYSQSLLGLIVVEDGVIRCWGTAVEQDTLAVRVLGPGVTQEGCHVYRIACG